jgi:leader peptidase (prepilin peptidase)/N-methyltransferase
MILSPPMLSRWSASVSRTVWALRSARVIAFAGVAVAIGVTASVILVPDSRGLWGAGLAVLMVAIAVVDARRFIIPDELTVAALGLGLAYAVVQDADMWLEVVAWSLVRGAAPALVFMGVRIGYRLWRGHEGIGLGDVKLAAVCGVWLDWLAIPVAIEIAAVAALGAYLVMFLRRRVVRRTTRLPFGLFLAPAIWLAWIAETTLLLYPTTSPF